MSHPPYHLRVNKAVERFLLVELLRRLGEHFDLEQYTYYGFGGPFLEDMRLIHHYFPEVALCSVESDEETFKRQKAHRFTKSIKLLNRDIRTFFTHDYEPGKADIVWLDYTDLKLARFEEFQEALSLVNPGSIVKVTVNASPHDKKPKDFKDRYDAFLPSDFRVSSLRKASMPKLLQDMFRIAAQRTCPSSSGLTYQILHSCFYGDGAPMFSICGMVCDESQHQKVLTTCKGWKFANLNWAIPASIDLPFLSAEECINLNKKLPLKTGSVKSLIRALGYSIHGDKNEDALKQYATFYRNYPTFIRSQFV